ncbi:DUF2752 domain-containing protein [Nocardioides gilvus]|uniref:DUF2752 domain-containing protein n=1 Tax=Nocardioides gilvus TaxID=1735589 RepID=UPI000D74AC10|nr:DUF2752 domain-containing protein [Nocardioides gilvus]
MNELSDRTTGLARVLGVGAIVGIAVVALHVRDPNVRGSWGFCPTALMGFDCPFCGGLRSVHHLSNVDLPAAASSNLLVVIGAPVVVGLWLWALLRASRGLRPLVLERVPPGAWWSLLAVLAVFAVVRNLPMGSWLAS